MSEVQQQNIHKHMHVYSSDDNDVGHVADVYEDSFELHKGLFSKKRYIPYSMVDSITNDQVHLKLTEDDLEEKEWEKRPDYEDHLGDPTQIMYDRGHGIRDPFDESNPNKTE